MVIAPAKTGSESKSKIVVSKTAHTKSSTLCIKNPGARILIIVTIKLIAPKIEDAPAKCKLKIARSTDGPECPIIPLSGGYTVHPVPAPVSTKAELNSNNKDGGNNQKLILFKRGNAISGAPIIIGTNQFPNPPIKIGITMKKIIRNAWAVIITLYN